MLNWLRRKWEAFRSKKSVMVDLLKVEEKKREEPEVKGWGEPADRPPPRGGTTESRPPAPSPPFLVPAPPSFRDFPSPPKRSAPHVSEPDLRPILSEGFTSTPIYPTSYDYSPAPDNSSSSSWSSSDNGVAGGGDISSW
jgi:hypothetical protein